MTHHPLTRALTLACALVLLSAGLVLANLLQASQTAPGMTAVSDGPVRLMAGLTQSRVYNGTDSSVGMAVTLACQEEPLVADAPRGVDLVVVLDRSGSMAGRKMQDAREAVTRLVDNLGPGDRFALVSYASDVTSHGLLQPVTTTTRPALAAAAEAVRAGGGTNLGGGLAAGMQLLSDTGSASPRTGNLRKLILISDGHANEGVTDVRALGQMAALSFGEDMSVTTVGVGVDYNENLMGTIADFGGGNYHFLDDPARFAELFLNELAQTRAVAARSLELSVTLPEGVELLDAAGYPVAFKGRTAVIRPGALRAGSERTIFLTLGVKAGDEHRFALQDLELSYLRHDERATLRLDPAPVIERVDDSALALASVNRELWEQKTLQEDYNRLRESVSADVARGDRDAAMQKIEAYASTKQAMNEQLRSQAVQENIETGLDELKVTVERSLAPSAAPEARKHASKAMQAESYAKRRAKSTQEVAP